MYIRWVGDSLQAKECLSPLRSHSSLADAFAPCRPPPSASQESLRRPLSPRLPSPAAGIRPRRRAAGGPRTRRPVALSHSRTSTTTPPSLPARRRPPPHPSPQPPLLRSTATPIHLEQGDQLPLELDDDDGRHRSSTPSQVAAVFLRGRSSPSLLFSCPGLQLLHRAITCNLRTS